MQRVSTLDGWRGIAILLVLVDHFMPFVHGGPPLPWLKTGQHGVTVFFVLSGYLITTKLLEQQESHGGIGLRQFYWRRCRRLMPCALTYLAFVAFSSFVIGTRIVTGREILACLFCLRNYLQTGFESTAHFWSLSLEEQFYLVWPALILLLGCKGARRAAILAVVALTVFRIAHWSHYSMPGPDLSTQARSDAILVGCLTAFVAREPGWRKTVGLLPPGIYLAGFCICLYAFQGLIPLRESVLIGCAILGSLEPNSLLGRLLSFRPLTVLGTISYSAYVWQQVPATLVHHDLHLLPYALLLVPLTWVSFTYLEAPFLSGKMKPREQVIETAMAPGPVPIELEGI